MMRSRMLTMETVFIGLLVVLCGILSTNAQDSGINLPKHMKEELPPGTLIGNIPKDAKLSDRYSANVLAQLRYRFLEQSDSDISYFAIEQETGLIKTAQRVDRDELCPGEKECSITLNVAISPNQYFEIINLQISILDENDNAPSFPQKEIIHQISELTLAGTSFTLPLAYDPDSEDFGVKRYELESPSPKFKLTESNNGPSVDVKLVLAERLDREQDDFYQLTLIAYDGGNPPLSGTMKINVTVEDSNDNNAKFTTSNYSVTAMEDLPLQTTILKVEATDSDIGLNGKVTYGWSSRTANRYGKTFGIKEESGEIFLKEPLDYEKQQEFELVVTAKDKGPGAQPAQAIVTVKVLDVNDNNPQITVNTLTTTGNAEITEGSPSGTFLAHISVIDRDSNENGEFLCHLSSSKFNLQKLQKTQYKIITAASLDREDREKYNVSLRCTDFGNPAKTAIKYIPVTVVDVNDHPPIFNQPAYLETISENNQIGAFIVQVNATDGDTGPNGAIVYSLHEDAGNYFQINPNYGIIRANAVYDHEQSKGMTFHVIATDQGTPAKSATAEVTISIMDTNDEAPKFELNSYTFGVSENQEINTEVGQVTAVDKDSDQFNKFEYSFEVQTETTFTINPFTGEIKTLMFLDREIQSVYYLTVVATNIDSIPLSSSASVTVYVADENDSPPIFDFPSKLNNTLYVSNQVPIGYVLGRIRGHDDDIGSNSALEYSIVHGNEDGLFDMDSNNGAVTTNAELYNVEDRQFELTVSVKDGGEPLRTDEAILNIIVNKSIAYMPQRMPPGSNFIIVISLASAAAVIIIILVVAIVLLKCQDNRIARHNYNCRTEAQRMLPGQEDKLRLPDGKEKDTNSNRSSTSSNSMDNNTNSKPTKKEVSFNIDIEDDSGMEEQTSRESMEDGRHGHMLSMQPDVTQHPRHINTISHPKFSSSTTYPPSYLQKVPEGGSQDIHVGSLHDVIHQHPYQSPTPNSKGRPWHTADKEMEVHHLLQLLKRDQDADSACSGETSNADSGKGPSEAGELQSHHTVPDVVDGDCPPELPPKKRWSYSLNHSYPAQPCMQSFHASGKPVAGHGPSDFNSCHNNEMYRTNSLQCPKKNTSDLPAYYTVMDSVRRAQSPQIPLQTLSVPHPQTLANVHNNDWRKTRDTPLYTKDWDTDNSPWSTLDRSKRDSVADDCTTTSGSYVVDVDDLNQDLEDMFYAGETTA